MENMNLDKLTLDIDLKIEINAPAAKVFDGLVHRLGEGNVRPDGVPMPMVLELRPGGRWYRDLGNDTGHCWGIVQSVKPPELLEFNGPLFMSYPVAGHVIARVKEENGKSTLTFRHRAFGFIDDHHREGVTQGWNAYLQSVKEDCE